MKGDDGSSRTVFFRCKVGIEVIRVTLTVELAAEVVNVVLREADRGKSVKAPQRLYLGCLLGIERRS